MLLDAWTRNKYPDSVNEKAVYVTDYVAAATSANTPVIIDRP